MPYCEFCDFELQPDAHFCGRCGQARVIHRGPTSIGHASQFGIPHIHAAPKPGEPPTAPIHFSQFGLPHQPPPLAVARSETPPPLLVWQEEKEEQHNVFFPVAYQPPTGTVPYVQGMPQLQGVPTVSGMPPALGGASPAPNTMPGAFSSPSSPASFSTTSVVSRGTFPNPATPFPPPVRRHPQPPQPQAHHRHHQPTHSPHYPQHQPLFTPQEQLIPSGELQEKPRRRATSAPKWLLIVAILLILVIGGGVLAAVLHLPLPGLSWSANTLPSQTQNITGNGRTNLQFFGAINFATMTSLTYNGCSGGSAFVFQVQGSVDGTPYVFSIILNGSTGSRAAANQGTYTSNASVSMHQRGKPVSAPWLWEAGPGGVGQETIVVNPDGTSGTVAAIMPSYNGGSGGTVTVSGSWTCNSINVPGGNGGGGGG